MKDEQVAISKDALLMLTAGAASFFFYAAEISQAGGISMTAEAFEQLRHSIATARDALGLTNKDKVMMWQVRFGEPKL